MEDYGASDDEKLDRAMDSWAKIQFFQNITLVIHWYCWQIIRFCFRMKCLVCCHVNFIWKLWRRVWEARSLGLSDSSIRKLYKTIIVNADGQKDYGLKWNTMVVLSCKFYIHVSSKVGCILWYYGKLWNKQACLTKMCFQSNILFLMLKPVLV